MIGEGEVFYQGKRIGAQDALAAAGMEPLRLAPKEGLALLNGTQAMAAVGGLALLRAERVARLADLAGAMTLEALKGTPTAFDERIQAARPHPGQMEVARHLRSLLAESEIRESHREHDPRVQDAYCLRCMPQVHGAVLDGLAQGRRVIEIEMGSATDNPLVFVADAKADTAESEILSGGNFHGAPLAYVFDYAAIVYDRPDEYLRTPHRSPCESRLERGPAAFPYSACRRFLWLYGGACGRRRFACRGSSARSSSFRRQRSDLWRQRRSCVDGHDGGVEAATDRRECGVGAGD